MIAHVAGRASIVLTILVTAALDVLFAQTGGASLTQTIFPGEDIQARVNAAPFGTTFILKAGVHRLQSIVPRSGNTFVGEPGAVLSGASLLTNFVRSGSYWIAADQTQEGARSGGVSDGVCRSTAPQCGYPEDLFIDDVER